MGDTTDVATMVATTAIGLLMLIPTTATAMVLDTPDTAMDTTATDMALALDTTDVDTMAMDTVSMDTVMATATATTDKPSLQHLLLAQPPHHYSLGDLVTHQDLSVNHHQLPCQRQMDHFSLSFVPHQCCQFQCHQTSVASNGEQEAYENQNDIIRQIKNRKLK